MCLDVFVETVLRLLPCGDFRIQPSTFAAHVSDCRPYLSGTAVVKTKKSPQLYLPDFFVRALRNCTTHLLPLQKTVKFPPFFVPPFFLQLHWLPTLKAGMESSGIRSGEIFTSVEPFLTATISYYTNKANKECLEKLLLQNKSYTP